MEEPKRVLIVEDSSDLRQLLELQLAFKGYAVTSAADGVAALAMADDVHPDVVLTDVLMPEVSGIDLARRLRLNPRYAQVPIVLYTGVNLENADLKEALNLPLVSCVQKGAPMNVMLAALAELTSGHLATS